MKQTKKTILLAEDDHTIADTYAFKLRKSGYNVVHAYDGVEALNILKTDIAVNIVLLDLLMPKLGGEQVLEKMRKLNTRKHTPVIILTNVSKHEAPRTLWHLGISDFIIKVESTPRHMTEKVYSILESKT